MLQVASAEAMGVQSSGNIIAVGSSAEVLLLQQPATQVKDLQGAFVMPASPSNTSYCYIACYCSALHMTPCFHIHHLLKIVYIVSSTLAFGV